MCQILSIFFSVFLYLRHYCNIDSDCIQYLMSLLNCFSTVSSAKRKNVWRIGMRSSWNVGKMRRRKEQLPMEKNGSTRVNGYVSKKKQRSVSLSSNIFPGNYQLKIMFWYIIYSHDTRFFQKQKRDNNERDDFK